MNETNYLFIPMKVYLNESTIAGLAKGWLRRLLVFILIGFIIANIIYFVAIGKFDFQSWMIFCAIGCGALGTIGYLAVKRAAEMPMSTFDMVAIAVKYFINQKRFYYRKTPEWEV